MSRFCLAVQILNWLIALPEAAQETTDTVANIVSSADSPPPPSVTILLEDGEAGLQRTASVLFNLYDNQAIIEIEEQAEYRDNGIHANEDHGKKAWYQRPRPVRIGLGVSF